MEGLSIYVLTIFPGLIESFLCYGIIKRALDNKRCSVSIVNIRDFATDRHHTVDDTPYGGGAGMVMKPDILAASLKSIPPFEEGRHPPVILLTPQGKRFDQSIANRLSLLNEFVLVCGRYRGVDERFSERYVDEELSVGDFVLSGGEAAALVVIDAVMRLIPGVMGDLKAASRIHFRMVFLTVHGIRGLKFLKV